MIIIIFLLLIIVYITNGSINFRWVECKSDKQCLNPFYICQEVGETNCILKVLEYDYELQKYIQPKEIIGNKPNWLASKFILICIILIISAFAINHYLWRKKQ